MYKMNDKQSLLINKWSLLLNDLPESKRFKYAQCYERIVKKNIPVDYKVLLGTAHQVFMKDKTIKPKNGKISSLINEFNELDFAINGGLIMDLIVPFVEATSDMIVLESQKHDKNFSHLEIKNNKIYYVH